MKVKSESEVAQLYPTPSDSMDYSPPGSYVHGICQARVLEWVAIAFLVYYPPRYQLNIKESSNLGNEEQPKKIKTY